MQNIILVVFPSLAHNVITQEKINLEVIKDLKQCVLF